MTGILDKYDESINLTYNYTYRMLTHLKNIKENYEKIKEAILKEYIWAIEDLLDKLAREIG